MCLGGNNAILTDAIRTVDGEGAARYIKSTNGKNTNTPIIAISAYSGVDPIDNTGNLFTASLAKPLQKADLIGKSLFASQCVHILTTTQP